MDVVRLIRAIDSSDNDYNSLYQKINVVDKEKTNFNKECYNEIVFLCLYLFHIKYGIDKLSKIRVIPNLIPRYIEYEDFKTLLEQYKLIDFHDNNLPNETNMFQEIVRLSKEKLLSGDFSWIKVYSSSIYKNDVREDGKIYVSIDNSDLYQFACLFLTKCLKNNIMDFEFKVNNNVSINRTDNVVIYFTNKNLKKYLKVLEELKIDYPHMNINPCHILGEELFDGVVIAKDYADGSSFTEKICLTILKLKEKGLSSENIVAHISDAVKSHLEPVIALLNEDASNKKMM